MMITIQYHEFGRHDDDDLRPEVVIEGCEGGSKTQIVWDVKNDRAVSMQVGSAMLFETAVLLLEAYLKGSDQWSEPHSRRGICKLWDRLDKTIEADLYDERLAEHHELTF